MHLSRLYIKNYRSIRELDLIFKEGKNVIVGRNNSGKSNIVNALDIVLGEKNPTYAASDNITEKDFYTVKKQDGSYERSNEILIWCELKRDEQEELNYDSLYEQYGFKIWTDTQSPHPYRIGDQIAKEDHEILFINEDELERSNWQWINHKNRDQRAVEEYFGDKFHFAFVFKAEINSSDIIKKDIRFLFRESEEVGWCVGFRDYYRNVLLQSAILHAFRNPNNELRLNDWSWYGKLIKHFTEDQEVKNDLDQAFEEVKVIGDRTFRDLKAKLDESTISIAFPDADISFQFSPESKIDLYKNCSIYIDDGYKSLITEKGSGIQSATIIGLFSYYTNYINTHSSALLCIEEPELYLHPHARRVISDRLDEFVGNNENQVILTTHSTEFIRTRDETLNIILVKKSECGTKAKNIDVTSFKQLLIDPQVNELFFADKVILCEGYDGYLLKMVDQYCCGGVLDEKNISVISVGGKDNFSSFTKLLLKLDIECYILADFDYLLRDQSNNAQQYGSCHESIENLRSSYFNQSYISGDKGEQVFKFILKFRNQIRTNQEQQFYTSRNRYEIEHKHLDGLLTGLRECGIYILDSEIENLFIDTKFLNPDSQKLTLDKVYELNNKISSGEELGDILNVTPLTEFLTTVCNK